jgi:acetyl esterase/lipase
MVDPARLALLVLATAVAAITSGSLAASWHDATHAYGTQTRQCINAYCHDADTPHAALLVLHGGYFNSGSKADRAGTAHYYAGHGFAVFSADYRYNTDVSWLGAP